MKPSGGCGERTEPSPSRELWLEDEDDGHGLSGRLPDVTPGTDPHSQSCGDRDFRLTAHGERTIGSCGEDAGSDGVTIRSLARKRGPRDARIYSSGRGARTNNGSVHASDRHLIEQRQTNPRKRRAVDAETRACRSGVSKVD